MFIEVIRYYRAVVELLLDYYKIYDKNRELIKKTGYLEPKERQISNWEIFYIKTLRAKEKLIYSLISKETGWRKVTVCRILNGAYDIEER